MCLCYMKQKWILLPNVWPMCKNFSIDSFVLMWLTFFPLCIETGSCSLVQAVLELIIRPGRSGISDPLWLYLSAWIVSRHTQTIPWSIRNSESSCTVPICHRLFQICKSFLTAAFEGEGKQSMLLFSPKPPLTGYSSVAWWGMQGHVLMPNSKTESHPCGNGQFPVIPGLGILNTPCSWE